MILLNYKTLDFHFDSNTAELRDKSLIDLPPPFLYVLCSDSRVHSLFIISIVCSGPTKHLSSQLVFKSRRVIKIAHLYCGKYLKMFPEMRLVLLLSEQNLYVDLS